jgi:hypothetical protein
MVRWLEVSEIVRAAAMPRNNVVDGESVRLKEIAATDAAPPVAFRLDGGPDSRAKYRSRFSRQEQTP